MRIYSRLPRLAPQVLLGLATTGARHGCRASVGGQDALSTDPRQNRGAQGEVTIEPPFLWIPD